MGTRNLTMVVMDGEFKIAQYGQWDGYPEGSGLTILNFLQKANLNDFISALKNIRFATDKEIEGKTIEDFPSMSREHGAEILQLVLSGKYTILRNQSSFAGDSLFCEFAYLIDMDKKCFEIYKGFNRSDVTEGRFLSSDDSLEKSDGYGPIVLIKSYPFDDMPDEKRFLLELTPEDEG